MKADKNLSQIGDRCEGTLSRQQMVSIKQKQEKMRDREGEQGRWPGYVNFTKVIFRSHQTEVCFPRGPPVLGMTSYNSSELVDMALCYGC